MVLAALPAGRSKRFDYRTSGRWMARRQRLRPVRLSHWTAQWPDAHSAQSSALRWKRSRVWLPVCLERLKM